MGMFVSVTWNVLVPDYVHKHFFQAQHKEIQWYSYPNLLFVHIYNRIWWYYQRFGKYECDFWKLPYDQGMQMYFIDSGLYKMTTRYYRMYTWTNYIITYT